MRRVVLALLTLLACEAPTGSVAHEAPAHVSNPVAESELPVVSLRKEASARLAIEQVKVQSMLTPATRLVGGEVIVPPGRTALVTAPVGGELREASASLVPGSKILRGDVLYRLLPFAPADRDLQARATREVSAAAAQLQAAEARVERLSQLGADKVVAKRAFEDAIAARDTLRADVEVARSRASSMRSAPLLSDVALTIRAPSAGVIRVLSVSPGQAVAGGTVLLELVQVDALQVRVPVYAGDLAQLDAAAPVQVRALTARVDEAVSASAIAGPPTSMPERATVDRYFALSSS
ncbi:MAG TPA: HlyD family efflux transporter periplasmic adaptor subunit, partial [Polyangiales bacterium]|nr:HlyD family efflux transporter periplasmic adaptor subunit [Polyangiales bacterium]